VIGRTSVVSSESELEAYNKVSNDELKEGHPASKICILK
jgi:hypothetical protein